MDYLHLCRGYSFLQEEHRMFLCNSLKSVDFSTDTSNLRGPSGLDEDDDEPANDNLLVDCGPDQECVTGNPSFSNDEAFTGLT